TYCCFDSDRKNAARSLGLPLPWNVIEMLPLPAFAAPRGRPGGRPRRLPALAAGAAGAACAAFGGRPGRPRRAAARRPPRRVAAARRRPRAGAADAEAVDAPGDVAAAAGAAFTALRDFAAFLPGRPAPRPVFAFFGRRRETSGGPSRIPKRSATASITFF